MSKERTALEEVHAERNVNMSMTLFPRIKMLKRISSSWRRSDGRRLDESRTTLLRGDSVLRIRDLEASDTGRYICVVGGAERQYFDVTLETSWQGK